MFESIFSILNCYLGKANVKKKSELRALILLCLLQGLNLYTLFVWVQYILKSPSMNKNQVFFFSTTIYSILLIINYFTIYRKRSVIITKYDGIVSKKRYLIFWTYVILSFSVLILSVEMLRK